MNQVPTQSAFTPASIAELLASKGKPKTSAVAVYNLMPPDDQCQKRCPQTINGWTNRFIEYSKPRPKFAVTLGTLDGAPCQIFHHPLSMLDLTGPIENYLHDLGDSSRNTVRKAQRAGYCPADQAPATYFEDIFNIRNSTQTRRGIPIPEYWRRPVKSLFNNTDLCSRHNNEFYGVTLNGKLVAYCTLMFAGEISEVNHLLGHNDHLKAGIMNLLMLRVVQSVKRTRPWVRAINYLYPDDSSLGQFKHGLGFFSQWAVACQTSTELIKRARQALQVEKPIEATPQKKKEAPGFDLHRRSIWTGSGPIENALTALGIQRTGAAHFHGAIADPVKQLFGDAANGAADLVVGCAGGAMGDLLGRDMKAASAALKPQGWYVVGMITDADKATADKAAEIKVALKRRLKAETPTVDDLQRGFRGTDFQLLGVLENEYAGAPRGASWLFLKKVKS
jgi:hypothetical protein